MIGLHEPNTFLFLIINSQPVQFRRNESKLYKIESGKNKKKNKKQKYHISQTKNESCKTSQNKNRIHYQRLKEQNKKPYGVEWAEKKSPSKIRSVKEKSVSF